MEGDIMTNKQIKELFMNKLKNIIYDLKLYSITVIKWNMWSNYSNEELQEYLDSYRTHLSHNQDDVAYCEEYNQLVYEVKYRLF